MKTSTQVFTLAGAAILFCLIFGCADSTQMNQSTSNVEYVSSPEFDAIINQSNSPVVADFFATWCGPCKKLSPILDEIAGSFTNRIKFIKVNIDKEASLAHRFNVEAIPTLLFFRDGKVVDTTVGLLSPGELKARLDSLAGAPDKQNHSK